MKTKLLSLFLIVIFNTVNAQLYVDVNATGANNGSSWTDAYTDLSTAITIGNALNTDIWVAAGTYKPHASSRGESFMIKSNVRMYGGFNGTETSLSERDFTNNLTILSGDLSGNDNASILDTEPTRQDNSYHIIRINADAINALIDGFVISGANANGSTAENQRGGAIISYNNSNSGTFFDVDITNCVIEKNTATSVAIYSNWLVSGWSNTYGNVDFVNCILRDNYSSALSSIFISGNRNYNIFGVVGISGCLFYNNVSDNSASCLYAWSSQSGGSAVGGASLIRVYNSTFTENTGDSGNVFKVHNGFSQECLLYNSIMYNNGSNSPFDFSPVTTAVVVQNTETVSDPQFVSPSTDDFRLLSTSPLIDIGNNSNVPSYLTTDLTGNNRIVNTTVDLGAYEYDATLNIESFKDLTFSIYPNPTTDILNIKTTNAFFKATIYDVLGKQIINSKRKIINVSNLSKGIYMIKVIDVNENTSVKQFIKK